MANYIPITLRQSNVARWEITGSKWKLLAGKINKLNVRFSIAMFDYQMVDSHFSPLHPIIHTAY